MVGYLKTSLEAVLGTRTVDVADYTRHLLAVVEENRLNQLCLMHLCPRRSEFYEQIQAECTELIAAIRNAGAVAEAQFGIVVSR